jgi:hypothetical protein
VRANLIQLVSMEVWAFLLALACLVIIKMLNGDIVTSGLLCGRISSRPSNDNQYFSPERLQLLVLTLAAAAYYLSLVMENPQQGSLPEVQATWPGLLGASNMVYLAGKSYARWFAK